MNEILQILEIKPTEEDKMMCFVLGHDGILLHQTETDEFWGCVRCGEFFTKSIWSNKKREN